MYLLWVDIDANDVRAADGLGGLYDGEADGAEAEDGDRAKRLDLGGVPHRAKACRDAAAEEARALRIEDRIDLGAGDLGKHRVLGECAAAHEVVDDRAVALEGEAARAVGHHALALRPANLWAQIRLRAHAEDALRTLALRRVAGDDGVADCDGCDALAHALDDGGGLVAENAREQALRVGARESIHVCVAQCIADDAHADLTGPWRCDDDLLLANVVDAEGDHRLARDRLLAGRLLALAHGGDFENHSRVKYATSEPEVASEAAS